jgi:hypothetical protein
MKLNTLILAVAGFTCVSLAQTQPTSTDNNAGTAAVAQPATQPAPPQVVYGGTIANQQTQVVPITGQTRIHGSTVPSSMMPRQESLGDAARRLKKKKYRKYHKNARKTHRAKQQPPYLR